MHTTYESAPAPVPLPRVARAMVAGLRRVRAHPVLNPPAFEESWRERAGHAVDPDHRPHLVAACDWLAHAQDATGQGGIARGYNLGWNPFFGPRAWQPAPGATGDIIPLVSSESGRHPRSSTPGAYCSRGSRRSGRRAGESLPAPRVAPRGSCSRRWARTA